MRVGVCRVELFINGSSSLKDRRRVVDSVKQRLRNRFNVSVAELSEDSQWQRGSLGISCVARDAQSVESLLHQVLEFIENDDRVEVTDWLFEIY
ncbi:DUF503 domain-containing protein [Candidatus Caldatribacterium sp. SIUC1]|uniref:DUF503 domain-containing protein n=1 Tax=Candidatus Caldatribacterium sp. SIUC1 TaxID=3418365 RepID=UPI003F68D948